MYDNLFDLIDNLPNPIPANSVPYFDWCNWTLITMPAGISCPEILTCIDCDFIMSHFSSPNGTLDFNAMGVCGAMDINVATLQNLISSSWTSPNLTIGNTVHDLSTLFTGNVYWIINDWITSHQVDNQATFNITGIDGMRYYIDNDALSSTYQHLLVGLPLNSIVPDPNNQGAPIPGTRQHGQVLTWDAINGYGYRDNNQCCAQTLWLDEATETLHISGTNSVRLGVLNNQTIDINGNILCISQPNGSSQCVDLSETNNHTLETYAWDPALHYFVWILNSNGILQNQVSMEHMNDQVLSITANLLSISQPGWLFNTVDLSETNNHTLEVYPWTAQEYEIGILNSNWVVQNTVSIEHMNNQTLSIVGNLLSISEPGWLFNTVDLSETNNHTLEVYPWTAQEYEIGILNSNWVVQNTVSIEHMNNQTLSIIGNLLSISEPGGLFDTVDLSETNNHTLETYVWVSNYDIGILNSNWVVQNVVSLEHMNDQVLSYNVAVPNVLNISQPGGAVQSVSLDAVNNHTLNLVAPDQLQLLNSIGTLLSTIVLPTFDCTDVMACAWIITIISNIAVLAGKVAAAEAQIALLRAELS